jgi:hypothetical protein
VSAQSYINRVKFLIFSLITLCAFTIFSITSQQAEAIDFTTRSLSLSNNSNAGSTATTTYSFSVVVPTGGNTGLRGVEVNFCTTPLYGACTAPTGMSVTSATIGTTSPASGGTLTSSNAGTPNANLASSGTSAQVRFQWGSNQTLTLPATVTFVFNNIQNPTTAGTFFARIGFFGNGDTTYTTVTDRGVVAQSVQAVQNVSFKVQETLSFCVGAMPNATVAYTGFAAATITNACAQSSGVNISLGIAPDATTVCLTPVSVRTGTCSDATTTNDNNYGYVMVATNAANGVTVGYRPNSAGAFTQGTLQMSGASCTFPSQTDSCIDPVNGNTPGTPTAMPSIATTEAFGMAVPAKSSTGKATNNLTINTTSTGFQYTGATGACTAGNSGTSCWNWNRTGSGTLATSTPPNGAVDNESLMINFAVKSAVTTPSGQYQVNIDYFSVPAY